MAKILGAVAYDPGTRVQKSTGSLLAMTAFDTTNARLTFEAPASGKVFWRISVCYDESTSGSLTALLGVLDGATVKARQLVTNANDIATLKLEASGVISGLTPTTSYTFDAAYGVENINAGNLEYGGPNNTTADDAAGALIFEIWEVTS